MAAKEIAFTITFPFEQGGLSFETSAEFQAWHQKETAAWSWLDALVAERPLTGGVAQAVRRKLLGSLQELRQIVEKAANEKQRSTLGEELSQSARATSMILSSSLRGAFIDSLRMDNPSSAVSALAQLLGMQLSRELFHEVNYTAAIFRGFTEAILYERGLPAGADAIRASLEGLSGEYTTRLSEARASAQKQITDSKEDLLRWQKEAADQLQKRAEEIGRQDAERHQRDAAAQEGLDALRDTYDEHLSLASPVKYWARKARRHACAFWGWSGAFLLAIVCGVCAMSRWLPEFLRRAEVVVVAPAPDKIPASAPPQEYWRFGAAVITITLGVWILRIMARSLLSNRHLQSDAEERSMMAQTYLSLIRRGALDKSADREVVLRALFRPSMKGIVREDASPPFLTDVIARIQDKRTPP